MTFTFDATLSTELAQIRFWIGDTDSAGYWLEDATITALLTSQGSVGGAAIAGVQYIIRQLSRPDFKADWLQVSNAEARKGYETVLAELRRQFSVSAITTTTVNTYRADSNQIAEPDYSEGAISAGEDDNW